MRGEYLQGFSMTTEPEKKRRMTFDEAAELIEETARDGDGAQKLRALQMVMASKASSVTLPPPLSTDEVVERLARVMKAAGAANCQFAYRIAFAAAKREIFDAMPPVHESDVPAFKTQSLPMSLKQLYKQFPEVKRSGYPATYPRSHGLEAQADWCRKKALQILRTREEARLNNLEPTATVSHVTGEE